MEFTVVAGSCRRLLDPLLVASVLHRLELGVVGIIQHWFCHLLKVLDVVIEIHQASAVISSDLLWTWRNRTILVERVPGHDTGVLFNVDDLQRFVDDGVLENNGFWTSRGLRIHKRQIGRYHHLGRL